jgi:hypothetical protein
MYTTGYVLFIHIFAAFEPLHRCFVPGCDGPNSVVNEFHTEFSIPKEHFSGNMFTSSNEFDPCHMYAFNEEFTNESSQITGPLITNLTCSETNFNKVSSIQINYPTTI